MTKATDTSISAAKEVCHQLREAICHLIHEEVFERDSVVIREMEAAIDNFNGEINGK